MNITQIDVYKFCDYVPLASSVVNSVVLCVKGVHFFKNEIAPPPPGSFQAYVVEKKVLRCLLLIFLPVVGNIAFAIYDCVISADNEPAPILPDDTPSPPIIEPPAPKTEQVKVSEDIVRNFQAKKGEITEYHSSPLTQVSGKAFYVAGSRIVYYHYLFKNAHVCDTVTGATEQIKLSYTPKLNKPIECGVVIANRLLVTFHQDAFWNINKSLEGEVVFTSLDTGQTVKKLNMWIHDITASDRYIALLEAPKFSGNPRVYISQTLHIFDAQTAEEITTFIPKEWAISKFRKLVIDKEHLTYFAIQNPDLFSDSYFTREALHYATTFNIKTGETIAYLSHNRVGTRISQIVFEGSVAAIYNKEGDGPALQLIDFLNGNVLAKIDTIDPPIEEMQLVNNQLLFTQSGHSKIMSF